MPLSATPINVGSAPNGSGGDTQRTGFEKTNTFMASASTVVNAVESAAEAAQTKADAVEAELAAQRIVLDNFPATTLISSYPQGFSQMRVSPGNGWPIGGTLTTNREANAGRQILQGTDNSLWTRYSQNVSGNPQWSAFERMAKSAELQGGSSISNGQLAAWAATGAWRFSSSPVQVDGAGRPTAQAIAWLQDSSAGVYTPSNYNAVAKEFDTITLTHSASGKTVTATVQRNGFGDIINDPTWTVT